MGSCERSKQGKSAMQAVVLALLFSIVFSFSILASYASAEESDILVKISYPYDGGYIWAPKDVEAGKAYPVMVLLSGGDGHNAFLGPSARQVPILPKVKPLIESGKVHPMIIVSPQGSPPGVDQAAINNFNKDNFRLNELLSVVDQSLSPYGIATNREYVLVGGHSNGGMWRDDKPGQNGVYAFIGDAAQVPLYAVMIFDGTQTVTSSAFIHQHLDGTSTKVFSYVGKNRQPGQLPTSWTNAFLTTPTDCGVDFDTNYFMTCKKAPDRDWFDYVTKVGGPGKCSPAYQQGSEEYEQCRRDNTAAHTTIIWRFVSEWLPRILPTTLPPATASISQTAGASTTPGTQPAESADQGGLVEQQGFRFIVLTDTHATVPPNSIQQTMVQKIIGLKPSFVVHNGDMISGDKESTEAELREQWSNFDAVIRPIIDAGLPLLPNAGNHDCAFTALSEQIYDARWASHVVPGITTAGKLYRHYSFDYQNSHFIMMYGAKVKIEPEQMSWLKSEVEKGKAMENTFVFSHVPLKNARQNVKTHAADLMPVDELRSTLKGIDAFIAGHNHVYTELDVDGIRQISCGHTVYHKGDGIPLGGTEEQEHQSIVVFDVVGDSFTYYILLGPDFNTTVDGKEVPAAPEAQAGAPGAAVTAGNLPIAGVSPPSMRGLIGLYDYFFSSQGGNLVLRGISRYPLGLGVRAEQLESLISVTPQMGTSATGVGAAGVAAGMETNAKCHYCMDAKTYLSQLYPGEYSSCTSSNQKCCEASCPPGTAIRSGVPLILQCSDAMMGSGGDCWRDGQPNPDDVPQGSKDASNYCNSACGVASMRMALKAYNIEASSKDLFCGGPMTVYRPGGSVPVLIENVAEQLGVPDAEVKHGVIWSELVSALKSGRIVVLLIGDEQKIGKNGVVNERCFTTSGHYITLVGASDNFVIANDPGGHCHQNGEERMVLSKNYVENTAKSYVII